MARPKADRIDRMIDDYLAMDRYERNELMGALRGVDAVERRRSKAEPETIPSWNRTPEGALECKQR